MRAAQLGAPRHSVAFGGKQAVRDAERRFVSGSGSRPEGLRVGSTRSSHGSTRIVVPFGGSDGHRVSWSARLRVAQAREAASSSAHYLFGN